MFNRVIYLISRIFREEKDEKNKMFAPWPIGRSQLCKARAI
jgi:hypothetical protein